jgi:hypothetical protein
MPCGQPLQLPSGFDEALVLLHPGEHRQDGYDCDGPPPPHSRLFVVGIDGCRINIPLDAPANAAVFVPFQVGKALVAIYGPSVFVVLAVVSIMTRRPLCCLALGLE